MQSKTQQFVRWYHYATLCNIQLHVSAL